MDSMQFGFKSLEKLLNMKYDTIRKYYLQEMLDGGIVFYITKYRSKYGHHRTLAFFPTVVMTYFGMRGKQGKDNCVTPEEELIDREESKKRVQNAKRGYFHRPLVAKRTDIMPEIL